MSCRPLQPLVARDESRCLKAGPVWELRKSRRRYGPYVETSRKAGAGQAAAHQARRSALSRRRPSRFSISRRSMNSLRALRPLRSDSIDQLETNARKRAAAKSKNARHLAMLRCGLPGPGFE
jgi:hypothetical protein